MTYENWKVSIKECQENQELQDEYEIVANWCTNSKKYQIQEVGDEYCVIDVTPTEAELAQRRIEELKQQLSYSDYVVIKIAEGSATAEEYADVLAARRRWRAEINALESPAVEPVKDNSNTVVELSETNEDVVELYSMEI